MVRAMLEPVNSIVVVYTRDKYVYQCTIPSCDFFSFGPKGIQKHCEAKHHQKATIKLKCSICDLDFSPRSKLFAHELNVHGLPIPSRAPNINRSELPNGAVTEDYVVKKAVNHFPCAHDARCTHVAIRSDYLAKHMQDIHRVRVRIIYECDTCQFQSLDANDFRAHDRNCPIWHNEQRQQVFEPSARNRALLREAIEMVGSFTGNIAHYFRLKGISVSASSIQNKIISNDESNIENSEDHQSHDLDAEESNEVECCDRQTVVNRLTTSKGISSRKRIGLNPEDDGETTKDDRDHAANKAKPGNQKRIMDRSTTKTRSRIRERTGLNTEAADNATTNGQEGTANSSELSNVTIQTEEPITSTIIEAVVDEQHEDQRRNSLQQPSTSSVIGDDRLSITQLLQECRENLDINDKILPPEEKRQLKAVIFKSADDRKLFLEETEKLCNEYFISDDDNWEQLERKEEEFREKIYQLVEDWNTKYHTNKENTTKENFVNQRREELEEINQQLTSRNTTRRERFDLLRRRKSLRQDQSAAFIRRKFNYRSKQVFEEIIACQSSPRCNLEIEDIYTEYRNRYSKMNKYPINAKQSDRGQSFREIGMEDVLNAIKKCNPRTSSGYDGITNRIWKSSPAFARYLYALFTRCFQEKRIPTGWKLSKTILIYKKGDTNNISSWRPINLQLTIAKLYTSILNVLTRELLDHLDFISQNQKGFMKVNGCSEHNFLAQAIVRNARRKKADIFLCSYDFTDAFGSVELNLVEISLRAAGFDDHSTAVIMSNYYGYGFWIKTNETSPVIYQRRGLKQGDPLSPILFNVVIESLSRSINQEAKTSLGFNHLLFADDLVVMSDTRQNLIKIHENVISWCENNGININVFKCRLLANLHGGGAHRRDDEFTILTVNGQRIPQAKLLGSIEYLGNTVGLVKNVKYKTFKELLQETKLLLSRTAQSPLHIHQKHFIIRNMILPKWEYFISLNGIGISHSKKLGEVIRQAVRSYCKLPAMLSLPFYHFDNANGGMQIQEPWIWSCSTQCIQVAALLNSDDITVRTVAQQEILTLIKLRYEKAVFNSGASDQDIIIKYLNGYLEGHRLRRTVDCMDPLAHAPRSIRSSYCIFELRNGRYEILKESANEEVISVIKNVSDLKKHIIEIHSGQWFSSSKPQSRKLASCRNYQSNSWLNTNDLSAKNYSFAIKARADVLPTRKNLHFWKRSETPNCRYCHQPEDIAHVLSFCKSGMGLRRELHDKVLQRLSRTANFNNQDEHQEVRINQGINGLTNDNLRPDIVMIDRVTKTATIIDLAITNQSSASSLDNAREKKIDKYRHIKTHYEDLGYTTVLDAIVFGNLGATDSRNVELMKMTGSTIGYIRRMHKYIINDILRYAYRLWINRSLRTQ